MPRLKISRVATALLCASLTLASACDSVVDPASANAGLYTLSTVNGAALPVQETMDFEGTTMVLNTSSGSLDLSADGSFRYTITQSITFDGATQPIVASVEGTWTLSGSTLRMTATVLRVNGEVESVDPEAVTAQLVDGRITMVEEGDPAHTLVFVR